MALRCCLQRSSYYLDPRKTRKCKIAQDCPELHSFRSSKFMSSLCVKYGPCGEELDLSSLDRDLWLMQRRRNPQVGLQGTKLHGKSSAPPWAAPFA
ncbi:Calcium-Transporting Atpase Type 2C Member 1 [Manis pentadactyla]|nr:Calcium-Transporting Atpase Type 2C Member 1 [Manis pentadactyla]